MKFNIICVYWVCGCVYKINNTYIGYMYVKYVYMVK